MLKPHDMHDVAPGDSRHEERHLQGHAHALAHHTGENQGPAGSHFFATSDAGPTWNVDPALSAQLNDELAMRPAVVSNTIVSDFLNKVELAVRRDGGNLRQLAESLGVTPSRVSHMYKRPRNMSIHSIVRLSLATGVPFRFDPAEFRASQGGGGEAQPVARRVRKRTVVTEVFEECHNEGLAPG